MKRILFIIPSLGGGGAEKVLLTFLKRLNYAQYEIHLCLTTNNGIYLQEVPEIVFKKFVYEPPVSILAKLAFNLYNRFRISFLERWHFRHLVDKKYDIIISFMEGRALQFHSYVYDRANYNISWVHTDMFTYHHSLVCFSSANEEKRCYEKMDRIVFVSNDALMQFQRLYPMQAKSVVIYNPIDRDEIKRLSVPLYKKRRIVIGTMGRFVPVKAHDRFLRVAHSLKLAGYEVDFWMLGEGELKKEIENEVERMGMKNDFFFAGFQNPPYRYLASMDIFLSTSIAEGFPLVVCEAMCLGVPVIATRCTGPIELIGENEYGVLTEHDDKSIFEGVKSLLDNYELMEHYRMKSLERSMSFDINVSMEELYLLLDNEKVAYDTK